MNTMRRKWAKDHYKHNDWSDGLDETFWKAPQKCVQCNMPACSRPQMSLWLKTTICRYSPFTNFWFFFWNKLRKEEADLKVNFIYSTTAYCQQHRRWQYSIGSCGNILRCETKFLLLWDCILVGETEDKQMKKSVIYHGMIMSWRINKRIKSGLLGRGQHFHLTG